MLWSTGRTDGGEPSDGGLFSRDLAPPPSASKWRRMAVLGAIALVSLGMWLWVHGSEDGAIRAMSPAQRQALYTELWEDLRQRCHGPEGRLDTEERCRQRAEYLLRFPQCDEACRAELAPSLPPPAP
jgi:cytochrome b pre-mRNA-processing protein 3